MNVGEYLTNVGCDKDPSSPLLYPPPPESDNDKLIFRAIYFIEVKIPRNVIIKTPHRFTELSNSALDVSLL